jgi:hypothetical protein
MKLEKRYATLIVVILILIFFIGFFSYPKTNLPAAEVETGNENAGTPEIVQPFEKTIGFESASCTVSGGVDILRFKIQAGNANIGEGEMAVFLDETSATSLFKDPQGNKLNAISLRANSISGEFTYTAPEHLAGRKITVSSPAGVIEKTVTCS